MELKPLKSSNIKAAGYDSDSMTMRIEFKNGTIYDYYEVQREAYDGLLRAPSKGKYFADHIKGKYPDFSKLEAVRNPKGQKGFVDVSERRTTGAGLNVKAEAGYCPACGTEAEGFVPPVADRMYIDRMSLVRENSDEGRPDDQQIHSIILQHNGGYIERCTNCNISFWVPARVAKVKNG